MSKNKKWLNERASGTYERHLEKIDRINTDKDILKFDFKEMQSKWSDIIFFGYRSIGFCTSEHQLKLFITDNDNRSYEVYGMNSSIQITYQNIMELFNTNVVEKELLQSA